MKTIWFHITGDEFRKVSLTYSKHRFPAADDHRLVVSFSPVPSNYLSVMEAVMREAVAKHNKNRPYAPIEGFLTDHTTLHCRACSVK